MWIAGSLLFKHLGSEKLSDLGETHYAVREREIKTFKALSPRFLARATETRWRILAPAPLDCKA